MTSPITDALLDIAALPARDIPDDVKRLARLSLFDWLVVAQAGADEPVARIIRDYALAEGGAQGASLIGGGRAPARTAALVNGTASHALDYDDTHFGHVGHVSVAVLPAALATAEEKGAKLGDLLTAFALGAEAACRFGVALGRAHYERGFHQTSTSGAAGAAVAAGRISGLTRDQMRNALGLVGTRASGLRSQFGTMGKPFNAGAAASNGVEAAQLARRGFIAAGDGLAGPLGMLEACSDAPDPEAALNDLPPKAFVFAENRYKLHACCHGLHAMIEGLRETMERGNISPEMIEHVEITTNPRWLTVCDKKAPVSGLEVKFSYAWLAGMVAHGVDTAARDTYSDEAARDPRFLDFARRVAVSGDEALSDTKTTGLVQLANGNAIPFDHDLADPIPMDVLESRLRRKAGALLDADEAAALWRAAAQPDDAPVKILLAEN